MVDEEVLVANRTQDSLPGYWVVTPLKVSPNEAVAVVRGFVELVIGDEGVPVAAVAPPSGTVTVSGWVEGTAERGRLAAAMTGRVASTGSIGWTLPAWPIRWSYRLPGGTHGHRPAAAVERSVEGGAPAEAIWARIWNAGQWFLFALVFALGYPFMLRRQARTYEERDREGRLDRRLADCHGSLGGRRFPSACLRRWSRAVLPRTVVSTRCGGWGRTILGVALVRATMDCLQDAALSDLSLRAWPSRRGCPAPRCIAGFPMDGMRCCEHLAWKWRSSGRASPLRLRPRPGLKGDSPEA